MVIVTYAFRLPITSASLEAHNKTNDPSPKVLIKVANKPPKDIFLFSYNDATTIVAPHPGITPNKEPIIGCAHLGPIWRDALSYLFLVVKLISAKPIIERGNVGFYDDNGIITSSILNHANKIYLKYYLVVL